ncbi:hypothetical protein [Luteipulveratus mongoliensis]|uniref:Uncharacterized protein n=1 Tax=Luteipulveratus mongoliensis TaxID=571913 RepID=A0A0K1JKN1_9MICO|nr:hypothetical protein [Luteipulveratus mongoliensis]AKU17140.1 hypothetical protein VV02_16900 [Luteipulveratus mongoliensis]
MTRPPDDSSSWSTSASSVADEAVRLVEALAGLTGAPGADPQTPEDDTTPEPSAATSSSDDDHQESEEPRPAGCSCQDAAMVAAVCQVCPVCRVAGLLHNVRPETMDRIADLLGMVAGSLQAVAADRRTASGESAPPTREPARPGTPEHRDEVLDVVDEDVPTTDPDLD